MLPLLQNLKLFIATNYRNVRGLGNSLVVFKLFEKLAYSNERLTKFESLHQEKKYLGE